jgi:exosortase C (VPDSG-CTERM-specific)
LRQAGRRFLLFVVVLAVCFAKPLADLIRLSLHEELFSHLPAIPVIAGYLVWLRRGEMANTPRGVQWPGWVLGILGAALATALWTGGGVGWRAAPDYRLPLWIASLLLFLWGGGFLLLGSGVVRALAFPALFLGLLIPWPPSLVVAVEQSLVRATAEVTYWLLQLSGTPVLRADQVFRMPGFAVEVAQECSGIRSSLVLFLTALLAGYLFLRTYWKRALLALLVVPLGIARNAFRILVISMLCVHLDPSYIDSIIHRRGGPFFFALSMIPFCLVLLWLWRTERPRRGTPRSPEAGLPGNVTARNQT